MTIETRRRACRRISWRLMTIILGLRYCGLDHSIEPFQRRLAFIRRVRTARTNARA